MSQILKDLNKLAAKMGAPIVGRNISEQVRAISTYYEELLMVLILPRE